MFLSPSYCYLCFNKLEIDNCFVLVACEFTAFGDIVGHVVYLTCEEKCKAFACLPWHLQHSDNNDIILNKCPKLKVPKICLTLLSQCGPIRFPKTFPIAP